ncbi:MAG: hypothetical protein HY841_05870 [Bacteroidetes bacterium]|nr:hypothetical protein [Bacteroidota bacterium]
MKKLYVVILFALISTNIFSQQITYSDTSWKSKYEMYVIGKCDKGVYVFTAKRNSDQLKDMAFNLFDNDLKKIKSLSYDFDKKGWPIKAFVANNELNLLVFDKKGLEVIQPFANKIITLNLSNEFVYDKSWNDSYLFKRFHILSEGNNFVIYMDYKNPDSWVADSPNIYYWTFDENNNVKKSVIKVNAPDFGKKNKAIPFYSFAGNYFFVNYFKSEKERLHFSSGAAEFIFQTLDGGKADFVDVNTGDLHSFEISAVDGCYFFSYNYSIENNKIVFSGFLTKKTEKENPSFASGTFKYIVDQSGGIDNKQIVPFTQTVQTQIDNAYKNSSFFSSRGYGRADFYINNGNNIYGIEGMEMPKVYVGSPSGDVVTHYTGELPQEEFRVPANIYGDIVLLCTDKTGNYKWMKSFERNEKIKAFSRTLDWGSYISCSDGKFIHIVYSDDGSKITHCKIDDEGNTSKNTLSVEGIKIYPTEGIQISDKAVVMPYEKDGQSGLIKIIF